MAQNARDYRKNAANQRWHTKLLVRGFSSSFTQGMFEDLLKPYVDGGGVAYTFFLDSKSPGSFERGHFRGRTSVGDRDQLTAGCKVGFVGFTDPIVLQRFFEEFNDRKLITEEGEISLLTLEVAPNQRIPFSTDHDDALAGTFENDTEFIDFAKVHNVERKVRPSAEVQLEMKEEERRKEIENGIVPKEEESALVVDLRQKHATKRKRQEAKRAKQREKQLLRKKVQKDAPSSPGSPSGHLEVEFAGRTQNEGKGKAKRRRNRSNNQRKNKSKKAVYIKK